jgi:VWFA-related protein
MCMRSLLIAVLCSASWMNLPAAVSGSALMQGRSNAQRQRDAPPGTIRVRVTLIPVDVIVTDQQDRPVTDLKKEDFQILENGRPQEISHFSIQEFKPAAKPPGTSPPTTLRAIPTAELAPQDARTFLIMMGRGRHQTPFKAVDALIRFIRDDLLPQDRVAVFAYNRATDFTSDHARIAQVLELQSGTTALKTISGSPAWV